MTFAATVFLLSLAASPGQADQRTVDDRWVPWMGCWELIDENVRDGDLEPTSLADGLGTRRSRSRGAQVCVNPAGQPSSVTLSTIVNNTAALEETVNADGKEHAIAETDCTGSQSTEWSQTGQRLFTKAQIACKGQAPRTVSGYGLIVDGPTWVDIQVIETGGAKSIRVRKYRRSLDQTHARAVTSPATAAGTLRVPAPFSLADVKEASGKLPAETIEAALVELNSSYVLDKKRLIELDDAGVPDSVIDVMIALAFPKKFEIHRTSSSGGYSGYGGMSGFDDYSVFGLPGMVWPFGYYDSGFWPAYYSPYAYSYWSRYDPRYYHYGGFVPVDNGGSGGPGRGPGEIQPSGTGRIVDGRGYTRVTTRTPERTSDGRGFWGDGSGNSSSSSGGSSNNNGGSSGASSSGYSSGGGGSSSGGERTAQPRPPGGN